MRQQPETTHNNDNLTQTAGRVPTDSRISSVSDNIQAGTGRQPMRSILRIKSGVRAGAAYSQCESYHGIEICRGV